MQRIIFATTNENKMKEIREILADFPVDPPGMFPVCDDPPGRG